MGAIGDFLSECKVKRPLGDIPCDPQLGEVVYVRTIALLDTVLIRGGHGIPGRWLQSYESVGEVEDFLQKLLRDNEQPSTPWGAAIKRTMWDTVITGIHPSKFAMHLRILNELRRADKIPELHIGLRLMGTKALIAAVKDNARDLLPVVDQEFIHAFLVGEEPTGKLMADMYDDLRDGPVRRKFYDHRMVYPLAGKPFAVCLMNNVGDNLISARVASRLRGSTVQCAKWVSHAEFLSQDTPDITFARAQYETVRFPI